MLTEARTFGDRLGVSRLEFVALALLIALAGCSPTIASFRILTYNTAFLYMRAEAPGPVPPPICDICDPLELSIVPCMCPELALWPNDHRFANQGEIQRAKLIAERIVATDQDVVALNEVFHPGARLEFVKALGISGPYKHFISLLRGHAPQEGLTLGDIVQMKAGEFWPPFEDLLQDLPGLTDFDAVPGDSGLMLFSKHPFLPLQGAAVVNDASCGDSACAFDGLNQGAKILPGFFAFKVFTSCKVTDCWASKGVGLVKIATPEVPRYVAFTHMQADYPDEGVVVPDKRAQQFATIRDFIVGAIPSDEIATAAIYLAGDLNVAGASRTSSPIPANEEWHDTFTFNPASQPNVGSGFFACGNGVDTGSGVQECTFGVNTASRALTDAWGFETSSTDRGISNENDGARLDFLVHSSGERTCMQHAMIAYDLMADPYENGGLVWLSDHLPLRFDFGTAARWCSANDDPNAAVLLRNVHEFSFGPTNCSASPQSPPCHQNEIVTQPQARLGPPGAFQWFRISQAGTYSIDLDPADAAERVTFVVYHHTDLSRRIEPFEEEEGPRGFIYSLPEPPYYIRTFAVDAKGKPDRLADGRSYTLRVHQHLCRTPVDACVLDPGLALDAPYTYVWPESVDALSDLRELWWRFKTSGVQEGKLVSGKGSGVGFPTVRIQTESTSSEPFICITQIAPVIQHWNDPLSPTQLDQTIPFIKTEADADNDADDDGNRDDLRVAPELPAKQDGEFETYFFKLTRNSNWQDGFTPCNAGLTSWVSYHTNLTYIVPRKLEMWAELDDDLGAEDNLRVHMGFDDSGFTSNPPSSASVQVSLEEPGDGSVPVELHGYGLLQGYYLDRVWPNLWEIDEEELLGPWLSFDGIGSLSSWFVSEPVKGSSNVPFQIFADGPNGDEADYYYYFWYKLCHMKNEPACKNP